MNTKHFISHFCILAVLVVLVLGFTTGSAGATSAGTAFTYQGQLTQGGSAVTGSCGFQFGLWDALTGGSQIGSTTTLTGVTVTNGLFTVQLDFGTGVFTGEARWLEIGVKCAGDLGFTTLTPRQPLTPAPYALYAPAAGNATTVTNGVYTTGSYSSPAWLTSLAGSKITGTVASATTVTNGVYTTGSYADPAWLTALAGSKITGPVASATSATNFSGSLGGDVTGTQSATSVTKLRGVTVASTAPTSGQVLQYNGSQWAPVSALTSLWSLTGNSGTDPLTNFLGTLDNVALEFKVNNSRALRLEPNATSPNILSGYSGNSVTAGVVGAGIGGGGYASNLNQVTDDYGVVGGGAKNRAGDDAGTTWDRSYATVGGGYTNTASGQDATVGGGHTNTASGNSATVGGGWGNTTSGGAATVGGGYWNTASGERSTVSGGYINTASGDYATVVGGYSASATHWGETAHASGRFASTGDAQTSEYVLRNTTSNATQTELFLDSYSSRITLDSGRTLSFDILIVAHSSTGGSSAGYKITGLIENVTGTTTFVGTPTVTILGEDVPAWDAVAAADDTYNALVIKVTGAASTTIRWVASVRTVEVGY